MEEQNMQENVQAKNISPLLQKIGQDSQLHKIQQKHPKITHMLLKDYTRQDINNSVTKRQNNKAHGTDGIPDEAYKTIQTWVAEPITHMLNEIKNGKQLPKKMEKWSHNTHLQKQKGMQRMQQLQTHKPSTNNVQNMV